MWKLEKKSTVIQNRKIESYTIQGNKALEQFKWLELGINKATENIDLSVIKY